MEKRKWTQRMTMHLNGGNKFSQLNYAVYCDGIDTGIVRVTRTNGSPHYFKTADELHCGDEAFDMLACTDGRDAIAWLEAHFPAGQPSK